MSRSGQRRLERRQQRRQRQLRQQRRRQQRSRRGFFRRGFFRRLPQAQQSRGPDEGKQKALPMQEVQTGLLNFYTCLR